MSGRKGRLLFVINEAHFFLSHRLPVARAAAELGYQVHVAAPDDHVWAPDGFEVDELRRQGFEYHRIPLSRRGTNPFAEMRTFLAILALFRRLRPDFVHLLTVKPVLYGGMAARITKVPCMVAAVTGLGQIFVARGLRAAFLRRAVASAYRLISGHPNCRIIVQNAGDLEILLESGAVARDRLVLVRGSGVDMEIFRPMHRDDGPPLVVLPSRMIWEKGVSEFVEVARRFRDSGQAVRFVLVGSTNPSNPRAVPERQLLDWQAEGVVEWWGRREDMADVMAAASVVCLPSTYGEGVPKVLIEAAACARPIVASDISGCREIVRNGENGLLVPPGDLDALYEAILSLVCSPETCAEMGAAGRRIVEHGFSQEHVARQTMEVYGSLEAACLR